ncbi:Chromosome partition protein Smc [Carpediemonas membranifera]|uniref:Chromosome partition protein Smc n=1 Tax=Carpediemonas membranifera TaxID=201153 RepID=A0A8J6E0W4_9EUKA|nr:Chromosome partition protein Smc [Carpediemonas membranifera]|eukprot:KAG9395604.1 Chromosome partition protein Smc [Carpediemonas membranifera]
MSRRKMNRLFEELDQLKEYNEKLRSNIASSKNELQDLEASIATEPQETARIEEKILSSSSKSIHYQVISDYMSHGMKQFRDEFAELKRDIKAAKEKFKESQDAVQRRIVDITNACQAQTQSPFASLIKAGEQLPMEIAALETEIAELKEKRDGKQTELDITKGRLASAESQHAMLRDQLGAKLEQRDFLQTTLDSQMQQVEQLRRQVQEATDGSAGRRREMLAQMQRRLRTDILRLEAIQRTADIAPPQSSYLAAMQSHR